MQIFSASVECIIVLFLLSYCFTSKARVLFVDVPYTLATEEAERIGVDHVARMSSAGNSEISSGKISLLK